MIADEIKLYACGALFLIAFGIAFFAGYMTRDSMTQAEDMSYRPEVIQPDGSVVLERVPDPSPSPPPHQLPKGAIEERRVTLQIRPLSNKADKGCISVGADTHRNSDISRHDGKPVPALDNPLNPDTNKSNVSDKPLNLTLSLIQIDGGRRVVASAEGAQIVGGMDIPIIPQDAPVRRVWAAGPYATLIGAKEYGITVERDWARFRFGVDAGVQTIERDDADPVIRARVLWTF